MMITIILHCVIAIGVVVIAGPARLTRKPPDPATVVS